MTKQYRGWTLYYRAADGYYYATHKNDNLRAMTRVGIEREIDKKINEISLTK